MMKLYGKKPVLERLKAAPGSVKKLYLQQRVDLSDIVKESKQRGLEFKSLDKSSFLKLSGEVNAQGVLAEVEEYRYTPFADMLRNACDEKTIPVFLDGVTDPQNLGSIIRNLACLGGFSLVVPSHRSAQVNETVLRIACGGENYISVSKLVNTATGLIEAKKMGFSVAGAVVSEGGDIRKAELKHPLAVVIGSEGKGIRPGVLKHLDERLFLPMDGADLSYNVAVATTLFCYEIKRVTE